MLGNGPYAIQLVGNVGDEESLYAAVVEDVPNANHTLVICRDEAVELGQTIHSNKGMFVAVQLDNRNFHIRIPNKHLQIKATTHYDLVLLTVSQLSHCSLVTLQKFDGRDCEIAVNLLIYVLILQKRLQLLFFQHFALFLLLGLRQVQLCVATDSPSSLQSRKFFVCLAGTLLLAQIVQTNRTVIDTNG